jgi:N-glycosidase YbiA
MNSIRFYRTGDKFGEFSNFANFPIVVDGVTWHTSEHYFQAQKFLANAQKERIRKTLSPMEAAKLGRDREYPIRQDWNEVKDDVMRKAVKAKFSQHPDLTKLLLSTGELELIEHTSNDAYWGDGGDGRGANMLGKILMEIRLELSAID